MFIFITFAFRFKPIIYYFIELRARPNTTPIGSAVEAAATIRQTDDPSATVIATQGPFSSPLFNIACASQAWSPFNKNRSTDIVQDFSGLTLLNLPSISNTSSQNLSIIAHDLASHPPKADMK